MQAKFHLKQLTVALAAAGFGLAVGAGYNRLDTSALSVANAATPAAIASPVASTAAARLPDFTALVERAGPAVVNISTVGTTRETALGDNGDEDNPLNEFFKRFGIPNGPGMEMQPRAVPSRDHFARARSR